MYPFEVYRRYTRALYPISKGRRANLINSTPAKGTTFSDVMYTLCTRWFFLKDDSEYNAWYLFFHLRLAVPLPAIMISLIIIMYILYLFFLSFFPQRKFLMAFKSIFNSQWSQKNYSDRLMTITFWNVMNFRIFPSLERNAIMLKYQDDNSLQWFFFDINILSSINGQWWLFLMETIVFVMNYIQGTFSLLILKLITSHNNFLYTVIRRRKDQNFYSLIWLSMTIIINEDDCICNIFKLYKQFSNKLKNNIPYFYNSLHI